MVLKVLNKLNKNYKQLTFMQILRIPKAIHTLLYLTSYGWLIKIIDKSKNLKLEYKIKKNKISVSRWGLNSLLFIGFSKNVKTQIRNFGYLAIGINRSFFLSLNIKGVGFKFFGISPCVRLELGQTHPLFVCCHRILKLFVYKRNLRLYFKSFDFKYLLWLTTHIHNIFPPVIYNGKGIYYTNEKIKIKSGKKK